MDERIRKSKPRPLSTPRAGWKPKLAMALAREIVDEIEALDLRPGAALMPEREMLERYGVARATLREALRYLELQGVIEIRSGPKGGPVVQKPNAANLANTFSLLLQFIGAPFRSIVEVRCVIEPGMAALAAERAQEDDIAALRECVDTLRSEIDDPDLFHYENRRFHDLVATASKNPFLEIALPALHVISDRSGLEVDRSAREAAIRGNARVLAAIADGNPEKASATMKRYLDRSLRYLENANPEALSSRITWQAGRD